MGKLASNTVSQKQSGFTLVELLVVIFIIGLMSGVVVMSLPDGKTSAGQQAEDLTSAIASLSREAIASGEPVSWTHIEGQNLFEQYRKGQWVVLRAPSRTINRISETSDVKVSVVLLGVETKRKILDDKRVEAEPPLVFFPTGEATPAEVRMTGEEFDIVHKVTTSGEVVFIPREERIAR